MRLASYNFVSLKGTVADVVLTILLSVNMNVLKSKKCVSNLMI